MRLVILFFALISLEAFAGNCTTTSRTNYSTGQILTSTALNADLNQLVSKVNSLDGGCITDGTLEAASLNATDFATVTNGIHQGCALTYVDANTVGVGKCILSVNGNFVKTTTANTVTWGCTDCSAEVVSTLYYVYARATSTGTTLNLLISTTSPGVDGYDVSGNKVLGRFYNNSSSAINKYSVEQWSSASFSPLGSSVQSAANGVNPDFFTFSVIGVGSNQVCDADPCTVSDPAKYGAVSLANRTSTGIYSFTTAVAYNLLQCFGFASSATSTQVFATVAPTASTSTLYTYATSDVNGATLRDTRVTFYCFGLRL